MYAITITSFLLFTSLVGLVTWIMTRKDEHALVARALFFLPRFLKSGVTTVLIFFYWTTNQQIIQRTFGASSLAEGQKGVLLTGALKLIGPLLANTGSIFRYLQKMNGIYFIPISYPSKMIAKYENI